MTDVAHMKEMMTDLIAEEIRRLGRESDLVVYTLYDPASPDDPLDYELWDREKDGVEPEIDVDFSYEGAALWYFCRRDGEAFSAKKILIQIRDGRFAHGQVGDFEGFWDEFPQYIADDRWVRSAVLKGAGNDTTPPTKPAYPTAGERPLTATG
jgi:hypothetical protein